MNTRCDGELFPRCVVIGSYQDSAFSRLDQNVDANALLIEIHYRHYLFHANMFVATAFAYVCYRTVSTAR